MFNLVKSNRMEFLLEALLALLGQGTFDPMAPLWVAVQSRGMKQWISARAAESMGVCANIDFLFPRQVLEKVLAQKAGPGTLPPDDDILVWQVMAALSGPDTTPGSPVADLAPYFRDDPGGARQMQLALSIANILDNYQVYRPDLLLAWEKKAPPAKDRTAAWQSLLWQKAAAHPDFDPLPGRVAAFLKQPEKALVPERICLFGISALPPLFLEVFAAISRTTEVVCFLLCPSDQFYFDIRSPRQISRMALEKEGSQGMADDHYDIANPLLASLGSSGGQFQAALEAMDYAEPFGDLFSDPLSGRTEGSMLARLQSDILNLVHRGSGGDAPPKAVFASDRSLCVHACHSPMREAQVLKDWILDAFHRDPDLSPRDIIVMMPDIEAYAPFIESVFSTEHGLPFSISDRRKRCESATLEAFMKMLDLGSSRLECSRVLELLRCSAVAEKFHLSLAEIDDLEAAVRNANVLWGRDAEHTAQLTGKHFLENTWQFGLDRLFTGYAAPGDRDALMGGVLPCAGFEGLAADLLGRFAHFTHTLFRFLDGMGQQRTVDQWAVFLQALVRSMLARTRETEADTAFLLEAFDAMAKAAGSAGFSPAVHLGAVRELLEKKLDQTISQGSFLAGGITFCNLLPMRAIPFKVVALMGMDEGAFPRRLFEPGFDLIRQHPRPRDKNVRNEDRYLFLEALLSARQQLIITYTGMSIKDNSPIPCSGVVSELFDITKDSFVFPKGFQWWFDHPLHPFHPAYFTGTFELFSYSSNQCRMARSQVLPPAAAPSQPRASSAGNPTAPQKTTACQETTAPISLDDLVGFFRHPPAFFIQNRLNVRFPEPGDSADDREPFRILGLSRYAMGKQMLDHLPGERPDDAGSLYPLARASGDLPPGRQGQLEWEGLNAAVMPVRTLLLAQQPKGESTMVRVDLDLDGQRVFGVVRDVYEETGRGVRCIGYFARLTPFRLLSNWIFHLCLSAARPDLPIETRMVGLDPRSGRDPKVLGFPPLPSGTAPSVLAGLAGLYHNGCQRGLPFVCDTGFALADSLGAHNFEINETTLDTAFQKAAKVWFSAFTGKGDAADPYTAAFFGLGTPDEANPFESRQALAASGMAETAVAVFRPLLEHLTQ